MKKIFLVCLMIFMTSLVYANPWSFSGHTFTTGEPKENWQDLCGLDEMAQSPEDAEKFQQDEESLYYSPPVRLPSSYIGTTTPIKDQGSCGSCFAFATVAPLEHEIKKRCGIEEDLSEQYLLSCNDNGWNCRVGGWFAHDYHMNYATTGEVPGAVLEANFPYTATDEPCDPPHPHKYRIQDWHYLGLYPSSDKIKQAIMDYGSVSCGICVGPLFAAYKTGIFNANEDQYCSIAANHAVALVGWGPGYWILKNSWGADWGESGYMRIAFDASNVGYKANYIVFTGSGCPTPPTPPKPQADLVPSFRLLRVYTGGMRVAATVTVSNIGKATSPSCQVQWWLSSDGTTLERLVSTTTLRSIRAGSYTSVGFRWISRTESILGKYLICVVDSGNVVNESDETNNQMSSLVQ